MTDEDTETIVLFLEESFEGLGRVETLLLEIEKGAPASERMNALFRDLHTIKGTSSFFAFHHIESLAHATEDLLGMLRGGTVTMTSDKITLLLEVVDVLRALLLQVQQTGAEGDEDVGPLVARVRAHLEAPAEVAEPPKPVAPVHVLLAHHDPVEVARLRTLLTPHQCVISVAADGGDALGKLRGLRPGDPPPQAEIALLSPKLPVLDGVEVAKRYLEAEKPHPKVPIVFVVKARSEADAVTLHSGVRGFDFAVAPTDGAALADQLRKAAHRLRADGPTGEAARVEESTIRVGVNLLDQLMNLVGELVLARNQILQLASSDKEARVSVMATAQRLDIVTSELQQQVMRTRMQPVARLFDPIPRMVRNISQSTGKEVSCRIDGNATELDRTFIELLRDPLMHIVRNAIDHGIEAAPARRAAGKPVAGSLRVRAYHEGGSVNIEIEDDGQGLDPRKLRARAVERDLMSFAEASQRSDREIMDVIFMPGFSTAEKVTAISGRGVGMDVVRTQVERAGGHVELSSVPGKGTTVRLKIPLTLAIVPALLVSNAGQRFAIPQINVVELVHLSEQQAAHGIEHVRGAEVYRLRGTMLPLLRVSQILKTGDAKRDPSEGENIVVVAAGDRKYGLLVDGVHDTVEIVVKPMHRQLKRLTCYSGATVLGDGSLALILDVIGIAGIANMKVGSGRGQSGAAAGTLSASQTESLLIFHCGASACAVPLSMVSRIEQVPIGKIETVAGREVLQYRSTIMPIVRPESVLGLGPTAPVADQSVVVFDFGRPIGFAVNSICDIVEVDGGTIRQRDASDGVLGSIVLLGRTTVLLDVFSLVRMLAPSFASESARVAAVKRVLVVEDSTMMRAVLASYLRSAGYEPTALDKADGALAALDAATQEGHPFSAVILDVEMPGTDGLGLLRHIRARADYATLPVVAVSQHKDPETCERAMAIGASASVTKLDRAELQGVLSALLPDGGRRAA